MTEQSEHLVLDYLRRVGDVARGSLRADERQDFLRRLRARIEELRSSAGANQPEEVRTVLARFGDPSALVDRERRRLQQERAQPGEGRSSREATSGGAGPSTGGAPRPVGSQPEHAEGPEPADAPEAAGPSLDGDTVTEPLPPVGAGAGQAAEGGTGGHEGGPRTGRDPDKHPGTHSDTDVAAPGNPDGTTVAGPGNAPRAPQPGSPSTPQALPRHTGPPVYEPSSPRQAGQELPSAASRLFDQLPLEAREALRGGAVEAAGLAFVGLGGALAPLPLWFIGALVVALATGWSLPEKLAGLLPPAGLAVVGSAFVAFSRGDGFGAYVDVLSAYGWPLFRVGAALGAAYLAYILATRARRRGSQQPPWQRARGR